MSIFCHTTSKNTQTICDSKDKNKTQENIENLLEHVVGNSKTFHASFQKFINLLQNTDRNFAALLDKF